MTREKWIERAARVRAAVTLSSVIGREVTLRKAGREWTGLCPFHHQRHDGSFMVNDDKGIYHCFACGADGDAVGYVMARKGWRFGEAVRALESEAGIDFTDTVQSAAFDRARERRAKEAEDEAAKRRRDARNLWLTSDDGAGSPAQQYLEGRGIDFARLGRWPRAIRYRADCINGMEGGRRMPAMMTAVHALDGTFLAVHRTFLECRAGRWTKAGIEKPKMVLGDFRGGAMPIWKGARREPLARVPGGLAVALSEGIEDALSVAMSEPGLRVLAAISLDNIGNVALPPQAGDLILCMQRDHDERTARAARARSAGREQEAAHHERCAADITATMERAIARQQKAAREQGSARAVRCAWPARDFKDFNDQLTGKRMGGA